MTPNKSLQPEIAFSATWNNKIYQLTIKDSAVDDIRDPLHMPILAVTIYIYYVIRLCILHYALPKSILHCKVCYIYFLSRGDYFTAPELYLHFYWCVCASYNGVCIDMFVNLVTVYVFLCLCMLYYLIFGYNPYWYFVLYIYPVHGLFLHCVILTSVLVLIFLCMLYLWSLWYVCVLHTIFSLVALHLGDISMHISCILIVMPFFPSSLTYIHISE